MSELLLFSPSEKLSEALLERLGTSDSNEQPSSSLRLICWYCSSDDNKSEEDAALEELFDNDKDGSRCMAICVVLYEFAL